MASMTSEISAAQPVRLFGGIDTHKDIHVAALLDSGGGLVGSASFPTTQAGYRQLQAWMGSVGAVVRVGVEGTGSYGAGICRQLSVAGVEVVEVNRPDRAERRRRGKSDGLDAAAAAEAARSGQRIAVPKSRDGQVESVRVLRLDRGSAVQARTKAFQQMDQLIVTGARAAARPSPESAEDEADPQLRGLATRPGRCRRSCGGDPDRVEKPGPALSAAR